LLPAKTLSAPACQHSLEAMQLERQLLRWACSQVHHMLPLLLLLARVAVLLLLLRAVLLCFPGTCRYSCARHQMAWQAVTVLAADSKYQTVRQARNSSAGAC
jgi:hypothetical protein